MPRVVGFNQDNVTKKGRFMRQQLLRTIVICGACLALGAQAQNSSSSAGGSSSDPSSSSSGTSSTYPSTSPGSSSYSGSSEHSRFGHMSATGRMGHEAIRGSQLTGAQVTGSSGSQIGTISDTIVDANSGRLEFAVISLTGGSLGSTSGAGTSTSSTSSSTSSTTGIGSTTSGAGASGTGKQVAVPWMLLRASSASGLTSSATTPTGRTSSSTTATAGLQQPSFTFSGDSSKLESAPNFDASTDLSQPSWRQSVFSYFGLSGHGSATGAAETPGGTSSSTSSHDSSSGK